MLGCLLSLEKWMVKLCIGHVINFFHKVNNLSWAPVIKTNQLYIWASSHFQYELLSCDNDELYVCIQAGPGFSSCLRASGTPSSRQCIPRSVGAFHLPRQCSSENQVLGQFRTSYPKGPCNSSPAQVYSTYMIHSASLDEKLFCDWLLAENIALRLIVCRMRNLLETWQQN